MAIQKQLPLPSAGVIRRICHISDIHIPPGTDTRDEKSSREDEFLDVFRKIKAYLHKLKADDLVICITGDIVHDNRKAGAACIKLFYSIINELSQVAPVYIIRGNHDYNQASIQDQDILGSFMHAYGEGLTNIAYMDKSGVYSAGNVSFGLVAIQDVLLPGGTSGCVENIPDFPSAKDMPAEHIKIALFHGDVPNRHPVEWFGQGYQYILLGDLHKMQVHGATCKTDTTQMDEVSPGVHIVNSFSREDKGKPIWAYPGSTIQQNYGESIIGHGFLMWNLTNDMVNAYHVRNEYGFATYKAGDNKTWQLNVNSPGPDGNLDNWIDMDRVKGIKWFPQKLRLRPASKKECQYITETEVVSAFAKQGFSVISYRNSPGVTRTQDDRGEQAVKEQGDIDLHVYNEPKEWCKYLEEAISQDKIAFGGWREWFENPASLLLTPPQAIENLLTVTIQHEIKDRNKKIQVGVEDYKSKRDVALASLHSHHTFKIDYMNWAYILCYKDNCHFNFRELNGKVCCIGGKNGYGKTSFLETICIALFGEGQPSRSSKHTSSSIICQQKPNGARAFTSIVFTIDDTQYRLTRYFDIQLDNKIQARDITLDRIDKETGVGENVHSGKKATSEWLAKHLGNIQSYLTSCMITQGFDEDFFAKAVGDQKEYLDKQLRLDSSTQFQAVLKATSNAYADIIKQLKVLCDSKRKETATSEEINHDQYQKLVKQEEDLEAEVSKMEENRVGLHEHWSGVNEKILSKGKVALGAQKEQFGKKMEAFEEVEGLSQAQLLEEKGVVTKAFGEVKAFWSKDMQVESLRKERERLEKKKQELQAGGMPEESAEELAAEHKKLKKEQIQFNINDIQTKTRGMVVAMTKAEDNITEMDKGIQKMGKELDIKRKKLEELEVKHEELVMAKPVPPHPDLDAKSAAWDKAVKPLAKKHKTIELLKKKLDGIKEPKMARPCLADGDLEKKSARMKNWLKQCKGAPGALAKELENMTEKQKCHATVLKSKEDELNKLGKDRDTYEKKFNAAFEAFQKVLGAQPDKPKYAGMATERTRDFAAYEKLKTVVRDLEKMGVHTLDIGRLNSIQEHYHRLHADMSMAKKNMEGIAIQLDKMNKHEFNAKCKCCTQNKALLGISKLEADLKAAHEALTRVVNEMAEKLGDENMGSEEYAEQMLLLKAKQKYDQLKREREGEAAFWDKQIALEEGWNGWSAEKAGCEDAYKKASAKIQKLRMDWDRLNADVETLKKEMMRLDADVNECTRMLGEWEGEYRDLKAEVEAEDAARIAWGSWEETRKDMAVDLAAWDELAEQQKFLDEQRKVAKVFGEWTRTFEEVGGIKKMCASELGCLEDTLKKTRDTKVGEEFKIENMKRDLDGFVEKGEIAMEVANTIVVVEGKLKQHEEMNRLVESIEGCNRQVLAWSLKQQLDGVCKRIDMLKDMEVVEAEIAVLDAALEVVGEYEAWKKLSAEIDLKKKKLLGVKADLNGLKDRLDKKNELHKDIEVLNGYWQQVMDRADTLKEIMVAFANFKDWVMQEKIVPMIKDQTNHLLDILCANHRPISLDCVFDDKGVFTWIVHDGPNKPPIEKASGFQRFVISLAARIVLGRMGVAGIKNNQLFIDEGFTACDDDNLTNVPDVLQQLLKLYHSGIVIVSHLDELRGRIGETINITRVLGEGTSQIQFGEVQEAMNVVKKKGRPKKVVV